MSTEPVARVEVLSGPTVFSSFPAVCCRTPGSPKLVEPASLAWEAVSDLGSRFGSLVRESLEDCGFRAVSQGYLVAAVCKALQLLSGARRVEVAACGVVGDRERELAMSSYVVAGVARGAMRLSVRLCRILLRSPGEPERLRALSETREWLRVARSLQASDNTQRLIAEAAAREIPAYPVSPLTSVWQFGQGVNGWHAVESMSESDSVTGYGIAKDKVATNRFLGALGYPVTTQMPVSGVRAAMVAAERLGFPCVVKPVNRGQGIGVSVDLRSERDVEQAARKALELGSGRALVEKLVSGLDYRITVVSGTVVSVVRRDVPAVIGDGRSTVRVLVREFEAARRIEPVKLDDILERELGAVGLTLDHVPEVGRVVRLRSNANISTGATFTDVTDRTDPGIRAMAEEIAASIRLDAVGLDYVCRDISLPFAESPGVFIEVNPCPGFRSLAGVLLDRRFPDGQDGRIGTVLVTGYSQVRELYRQLLTEPVSWAGVGVTSTVETRFDGRSLVWSDDMGLGGRVRGLIYQKSCRIVIVFATLDELIQQGLPLDRFDVVIVPPAESGLAGFQYTLGSFIGRIREIAPEAVIGVCLEALSEVRPDAGPRSLLTVSQP